MVTAVDENEVLTDDELVANPILQYIAGHETATHAADLGLTALHRHPDQLALLKADRDLIPDAVDELLRYDAPRAGHSTDHLVADHVRRQGDPRREGVAAWIGAANRDPAQYADSVVLDVRRRPEQVVTLGGGAHYCIGQALARQELQVTVEVLPNRLPNLAVTQLTSKRAPAARSQYHRVHPSTPS
jgi:cytochrome P450